MRWPVWGGQGLTWHPVRTREEPAIRVRVGGPAWAPLGRFGYPPSRFWPLPGLRRWQGAAPAGWSGAAGAPAATGEAVHAGRPAAAPAAGTGHRRPVGAGDRGVAVPGPVPVSWSPDGATVRPVRWLPVPAAALGRGSAAAGGISRGHKPVGDGPVGAPAGHGPAGVVLRTAARPRAAWPGRVARPVGAGYGRRGHRRPAGLADGLPPARARAVARHAWCA